MVVQHMKPDFIGRLPERLQTSCTARVVAAEDGAQLRRGHVYVATDPERHLRVELGRAALCRLVAGDPVSGHRPSVDALFASLVAFGKGVSAALLTGMGRDGAAGLKAIRDAGGSTIAQDATTCVVYGMPKAAVEAGAAEVVLPVTHIAAALLAAKSESIRQVGL